jgi:hypothetical protein
MRRNDSSLNHTGLSSLSAILLYWGEFGVHIQKVLFGSILPGFWPGKFGNPHFPVARSPAAVMESNARGKISRNQVHDAGRPGEVSRASGADSIPDNGNLPIREQVFRPNEGTAGTVHEG